MDDVSATPQYEDEKKIARESVIQMIKNLYDLKLHREGEELVDGFLGLSNWSMDPAKNNRNVKVPRNDPDQVELGRTAKALQSSREEMHTYPGLQKLIQDHFGSNFRDDFDFPKENNCVDCAVLVVPANGNGMSALVELLNDTDTHVQSVWQMIRENCILVVRPPSYDIVIEKRITELPVELTQSIDRVIHRMENGETVILLNQEPFSGSLYDVLNQYCTASGDKGHAQRCEPIQTKGQEEARALGRELNHFFPTIGAGFSDIYRAVIAPEDRREFFGLRDFYCMVKMLFEYAQDSGSEPINEEIKRAILRNFGGLPSFNPLNFFQSIFGSMVVHDDDSSITDLIRKALDRTQLLTLSDRWSANRMGREAVTIAVGSPDAALMENCSLHSLSIDSMIIGDSWAEWAATLRSNCVLQYLSFVGDAQTRDPTTAHKEALKQKILRMAACILADKLKRDIKNVRRCTPLSTSGATIGGNLQTVIV